MPKKTKANIAAIIMEKITMKISVSRKLGLVIADDGGGKRRAVIAQHGFLQAARQEFSVYQKCLCGAFNQSQNEQQHNPADESVDNRGNNTSPDYNAELRQQPASD